MPVIKIITDPYRSEASFYTKNGISDKWEPIENAYSGLVSEQLRKGRFATNAEIIADTIVREFYTGGEAVKIVFEGTSREFGALAQVCGKCHPDICLLVRSDLYLSDADEIAQKMRIIAGDLLRFIKHEDDEQK